jgi:hypothetical protein
VIIAEIPPGSRFRGYQSFPVRDLVISVQATRYQRERRVTPDGRTILAPLPEGIEGNRGKKVGSLAIFPCVDSTLWILCVMCRRRPPFPF